MNKITYLSIVLCVLLQIDCLASNEVIASYDNAVVKPQRVRIHCTTHTGYVRHLLLAFTPDNIASDDYDPGYDAYTYDYIPDDLNWIINDSRFVVQGVGAFDKSKKFPLGMFITNSGVMEIGLTELENFESEIDVFIYDSELDIYSKINEAKFTTEMTSGEYKDRFYIAFEDPNAIKGSSVSLSTNNQDFETATINYYSNNQELKIKTSSSSNTLKSIEVYNILGQRLIANNYGNITDLKISSEYLTKGINLIKVETDLGIKTKKVIVN